MTTLDATLLELEERLGSGDGDTYRELLVDEAVVIVPGQALTKETTAAAMDASPGWDDFAIDGARVVSLGEDAAILTYRFEGRRATSTYAALMSSVYVRRDGEWRMVFHQQTPIG